MLSWGLSRCVNDISRPVGEQGEMGGLRLALPVLATLAIVAPLAWMWQASRMPGVYSVMDMGYLDYGGGAQPDPSVGGHGGHGEGNGHDHHSGPARSITDLVADPTRPADVRVDLVTRQEVLTIGGRSIAGFTVNGTSPGPEIRAKQGQLIEVHLRNESVAAGVALHWHGVDVPNAMDGVAGVTQDAVPVGAEFIRTDSSPIELARSGITPTRSPTLRLREGCSGR